jgi:hypothetical protein
MSEFLPVSATARVHGPHRRLLIRCVENEMLTT